MEPQDLFRWELETEPSTAVPELTPSTPDTPQGGGATHAPEVAPAATPGDALRADEVSAAPALPRHLDDAAAPVLVHAMRGSMDAGHAGALVVSHLLETHASKRVATFDIDELLDYRSRRPTVTFSESSFTDYADPSLALDYLATDAGGLLLLHGPEPDLRWEAFSSAVRVIVERLGVRTTVGVHGIPMGVPHTRPMSVTSHATREGLVDVGPDVFGTVQVPGSASSLLEYRLGGWGHDAMGFAVHVPHYLAQAEYPAAAAELVRRLARVTGAHLDITSLETTASTLAEEIDRQVADSPEVAAVVQALETQYDAYQDAAGRSLLASGEMPTGDELAAQFEAFLADHDDSTRGEGPQDGPRIGP